MQNPKRNKLDRSRARARIGVGLALAVLIAGTMARGAEREPVAGFVSTVSPLATEAGLGQLRDGGNAIDAAVAAALALGVVDGHNSGIGGGCFIVMRLADGLLVCIDGRETAPAAATQRMFYRDGEPDTELSQDGALASGVPGALAAYHEAASRYGKLPWAAHFAAGIRLARDGFAVDGKYAGKLERAADDLARFPASAAQFLEADGSPYAQGETLKLPDLAASYEAIAAEGPGWFYDSGFPELVETWMKANGGVLTAEDFRGYATVDREPLRTTYRGYEVVGFPPPSSGGVHVGQMLNMLEPMDLAAMKPDSAEFAHLLTETMKLAFADRAYWLGDPGFANVPRGLIDKDYARELAGRVDRAKATVVDSHGTPPGSDEDFFSKHTTHFCAADALGNVVSITATINTAFGSKVVIPGTGILMNNEMDDFSIAPGKPNHFGLIGGEANRVEAGKRPLSSMSPTIVLEDGKPVLAIGAAGGPTIITQVLLGIVGTLDFGLGPEEALAQPRFHHQWVPDEIKIERGFPAAERERLEAMGHRLDEVSRFGAAQVIAIDPATGALSGASDPRVEGLAAGVGE